MDPAMKKEYRNEDGKPGFISAWDSENKKVGTGEQEIIQINEGVGITTALRFYKPFSGKAVAQLNTSATSHSATNVIWQLDSGMHYPVNIMLLIINMEKLMGEDLSQGLSNLKWKLNKNY